jgi:hypothetical protein
MSSAKDWQRAFARQALADLDTWDRLQHSPDLPQCHKLHFLQMACEKLAKAHLLETVRDPYAIQRKHGYVAKTLPLIATDQFARRTGKRPKRYDFLLRQIRHLAREIDLLSPAVHGDRRRPENCEYPWERDGTLCIPADYTFPNLSLLAEPVGRTILKIVHEAISHLAGS